MKVIENNIVYNVVISKTSVQEATIKEYFCSKNKLVSSTDQTSITTSTSANLTFKWQTFDLEAEAYVDDTSTDSIVVGIEGHEDITLIPVNGAATLEFSSAEPGTYTITTKNDGVGNNTIEIEVV